MTWLGQYDIWIVLASAACGCDGSIEEKPEVKIIGAGRL